MNWALLEKMLPMLFRVGKAIYEGLKAGASNEEIRRRASAPDVILAEELDQLREAEDDLENFIRTGR